MFHENIPGAIGVVLQLIIAPPIPAGFDDPFCRVGSAAAERVEFVPPGNSPGVAGRGSGPLRESRKGLSQPQQEERLEGTMPRESGSGQQVITWNSHGGFKKELYQTRDL